MVMMSKSAVPMVLTMTLTDDDDYHADDDADDDATEDDYDTVAARTINHHNTSYVIMLWRFIGKHIAIHNFV